MIVATFFFKELDGLLKNRKHISQESVADVMKKLDTDGDVEVCILRKENA